MLGDMLGAHPECLCLPETQFIIDVERMMVDADFDAKQCLNLLVENWRYKRSGIRLFEQDRKLLLEQIDAAGFWETLIDIYARSVGKGEASVVVDHTPENSKSMIDRWKCFPEAKYIHLIRDGRACFSSVKKLKWGTDSPRAGARWWESWLGYGFYLEQAYPHSCQRVHYESLVRDSSNIMTQLCEFIGIEYDIKMLNGGGLLKPDYTKSQHKLVGKAPTAARLQSWRNELSYRDLLIFNSVCWPMLTYLGYEDWPNSSREIRRVDLFISLCERAIRRAGEKISNV
jgi:hypothetical protein